MNLSRLFLFFFIFLFLSISTASATWLNVTAENKNTLEAITNFTVTINGTTESSVNGSVNYTIGLGTHLVIVQAAGYYANAKYVIVIGNQSEVFSLTPHGTFDLPHYVQFIVQSMNGTRYPDVLVTVYDDFGTYAIYSGLTGGDGAFGCQLIEDRRYNITFYKSPDIDFNRIIYPVDIKYIIYIEQNVTFTTVNITNTTLTNYTTVYTNRSWSLQNLTSTDLNSSIGLGPLGQGIISSGVVWVVVGAGGVGAAVAVSVVLAMLGIVSWVMVIFCVITVIALYVLQEKIG